MEIYFLRHAIAAARGTAHYPNDDRPLTEEGREKMEAAAKGIRAMIDTIDIVYSSPLIRAHDTAKIAAEALGYRNTIVLCKQLLPGRSAEDLFLFLRSEPHHESLLLVGHEPGLSNAASHLIGADRSVLEFKKGGICCIECSAMPPDGIGTLLWLLQPKQLRALAR